jgi:cellulose biosynthesis protein BcsQ
LKPSINSPISSTPYLQEGCLPPSLNPLLSNLLTALSHLTLPVILKYFHIKELSKNLRKRKYYKKLILLLWRKNLEGKKESRKKKIK